MVWMKFSIFNREELESLEKICKDDLQRSGKDWQILEIWSSSGSYLYFLKLVEMFYSYWIEFWLHNVTRSQSGSAAEKTRHT